MCRPIECYQEEVAELLCIDLEGISEDIVRLEMMKWYLFPEQRVIEAESNKLWTLSGYEFWVYVWSRLWVIEAEYRVSREVLIG